MHKPVPKHKLTNASRSFRLHAHKGPHQLTAKMRQDLWTGRVHGMSGHYATYVLNRRPR